MPDTRAQQAQRETHREARGSAARVSGDLYFLDAQAVDPVRIPHGASVLSLEGGRACLRPVPASGALRAPTAGTALIETVAGRHGEVPGLAVVPGPACDLRLNAEPAPCLAWTRPGDELWLGNTPLRLVLRRGAHVGPPRAEHLGRPCAQCQVPIADDTRVWACPQPACGVVMHLEGDETPPEARLDCARLGDCPGCGAAVKTEPTWIGGAPDEQPEEWE
jgi:hypothetical protein